MFIARGVRGAIQRELDSFYREVVGTEFNIREVTKGAFTQARAKLRPEAFLELNASVNHTFYSEAPYLVWHNMRLLSADGTRLVLPRHPSVREEFGEHGFGPNADSPRSLALGSILYDCLNLLTLDAQLAPYASSERELLYRHLDKVRRGDLLLLDRGYPSIALLFLLTARGVEFCVRMKEDWWLTVKDFKESGERQRIVSYALPKKDQRLLRDYPDMQGKDIRVRLVRVELGNGETEVLCTSLLDAERYTYDDIVELYHYRWSVEEGYKLYKSRIELESFSGKTALAVKQDFFAKVFIMSLCAVLAFPIEERVRRESACGGNKHRRKVNRTNALSVLRSLSVALLLKGLVRRAMRAYDLLVGKTTEIVRPGRKAERKKRPKKLYCMNYKQL